MIKLFRAATLSAILILGVGVSSAQAVTLPLTFGGDSVSISISDLFDTGQGSVTGGVLFSHVYEFKPTTDLSAIATTIQFSPPTLTPLAIGISLLTMSWAGGPSEVLTNAAGFDDGGPTFLANFLSFAGGVATLTISGTAFADGGTYRLLVEAVPVPAALPLFGTGLGILGFLGWRRRRKLTAQAAA